GWPLPEAIGDAELEARLYPPPPDVAAHQRPLPDWAAVHRELRRPNVTLSLLWEEYRAGAGRQDGFGYSWFCELYREWAGRLKPTWRRITAPRSCQRAPTSRATKPKWKSVSRSCSAGFWHGCATGASSRSVN